MHLLDLALDHGLEDGVGPVVLAVVQAQAHLVQARVALQHLCSTRHRKGGGHTEHTSDAVRTEQPSGRVPYYIEMSCVGMSTTASR